MKSASDWISRKVEGALEIGRKPHLLRVGRTLLPGKHKELPFIIFACFLVTLAGSRFISYFLGDAVSLTINGVHIHHYNYGIIVISMVSLYALLYAPTGTKLYLTAMFLGLGLGMTYDEFGMWLHLRDDYWMRTTYDALGVICALFINYLYFGPFWKKVGRGLFNNFRKSLTKAGILKRQ